MIPGANLLWTQSLILFLHTHNFTPTSFTSLHSHLPITYYTLLNQWHSRHVPNHTYMNTHKSTSHSGTALPDFSSTSTGWFMDSSCYQGTPVQQEHPPQATHILFAPMQLVQLCFIPAQLGLQTQHLGLGCPLPGDCSFSSLFHLHRKTTLLHGCPQKNVFSLPVAHKSPLKFNWHILIHKQQLSLEHFSVASRVHFFNSADKQHQHITCISLNTMILMGLVISWEDIFSILAVPLSQPG